MENQKIKPKKFSQKLKAKMLVSVLCLATLGGIVLNVHEHNEINQLSQVQEKLGISEASTVVNVKVYYHGKMIENHILTMNEDIKQSTETIDNLETHEFLSGVSMHDDNPTQLLHDTYQTGEKLSLKTAKIDKGAFIDVHFIGKKLSKMNQMTPPAKYNVKENIMLPEIEGVEFENSINLKSGKSYSFGNKDYKFELSVV